MFVVFNCCNENESHPIATMGTQKDYDSFEETMGVEIPTKIQELMFDFHQMHEIEYMECVEEVKSLPEDMPLYRFGDPCEDFSDSSCNSNSEGE